MKFFVTISHKDAVSNYCIPVNLPKNFYSMFIEMFLGGQTKSAYKVELVDEYPLPDKYEYLPSVNTIEELVEVIKGIKLYKVVKTPITAINKRADVIPFKLSCCFVVSEVSRSTYCTFFKVDKDPEGIKDIIFDDSDLKKTLKCKVSKNGYYYLVGDWHFFRSASRPTLWEARKFEEEIVDYNEEAVEL